VHCPYCVSEINEQAVVCPVCRRDLYLFKPLLSRIEALEKRVSAQDEALSHRYEAGGEAAERLESVPMPAADEPLTIPTLRNWLSCWLSPLVLLILAHGLIIMLYDLNTLYLRVVSLLIPLPFGLLLVWRERRPLWLLVAMAVSLSGLAVLGMSSLTSLIDGTPVLPVGVREWREFVYYASSIALSYTSSIIVGRKFRLKARAQMRQEARLALARLVSKGSEKTEQFQTITRKFNDLGATLTAAATTAASIYAGLQGFIGK